MKTAVEYAEELINVILYYIDEEDKQRLNEVFNDAKKIEKQQIIEAHGDKKKIKTNPDSILPHGYTLTGEMYYNETFKK